MESNGIPVPLDEKQAKLMSALADELTQRSINITPGSIMYFAGYLAERVVKEGWTPSYPDPTPEQEVEIMDRIVSGLPMRPITDRPGDFANISSGRLPIDRTPFIVEEYMEEQGEKLNLANVWKRIPEFDNYEVSPLGVIRSRWTKRVLDQTLSGSFMYVDMHDKDGNPHLVSVEHIVTSVFS